MAAAAAPGPSAEQASGPGLGLLVLWEGVSHSLDARQWGWSASDDAAAAGGGQAVFGLGGVSAALSGGKLVDQGVADSADGPKAATDNSSLTRSPTSRASTRSPPRGSPSRLLTSLLKSSRSPTKSSRSPNSKLKSPRLKSQSPSRRRARSNRKLRTPVPAEVIERMAKSAPGKVTSPLERGLYIQKVPLLQGLLVADSANEKQTDRKVTSLLVADSPHEKQAERKAAESSHAQHRDRKAASLLPADVLHEQQNDWKVADPPVAPPREQQTDGKSTGQPHEKQTDGSRQAAAVPQAKQSAEEPRRPRAAAPAAAEGGELRVVRQSSAATSVLDGAEQVEFSAAEAASDLPEVTPTSTATSCAPRRLLSNLPEGSFLRARRMKALAAREDGLAQTGMAESTVQPGDLAPEVVVKSASSPSSSPTRGPSSQRPAKPLHRPPDPPRGRDLGHEGCSQRSYTSDPPSDPRLQ
ncbi:unnamed protein product, partial [Prorocentrum cordatum]